MITILLKYWKLFTAALVALVLLLVWFFWKRNVKTGHKENENEPIANITEAQAEDRANILLSAMGSPGTDEQAIFNVLMGINRNGYIRISNAFGKQPYDGLFGVLGISWLFPKLNLTGWLKEELSSEDFNSLQLPI